MNRWRMRWSMLRRGWAVDPDIAMREALRDEVARLLGNVLKPQIIDAVVKAMERARDEELRDAMARHMPGLVREWAKGITEDELRPLIQTMVEGLIRKEIKRIRDVGI